MTYWPKHYLDVGFTAIWVAGEPMVKEPDKLESWNWYSIDELPQPLFSSVDNYFDSLDTGQLHYVARS